jgi:hypothetical protein
MHDPITLALRWTARLSSAAIVAVVALFYVGEGGFAVARPSPQEWVLLALFSASCLGLVAAWRWELIGGVLNIGGMGLFYLVHCFVSGGFPRGWAFAVIAMPGVLFLAYWWRTRPKMRGQMI